MLYDVILWDFDGTLCDSHSAVFHCMHETFFGGVPTDQEKDRLEVLVHSGTPLEQLVPDLFPEGCERSHLEKLNSYRSCYATEGKARERLFDGVTDTLKTLHDKGVRHVIVTNKKQEMVEGSIEAFGLSHLFEGCFGAASRFPTKPCPSLLHEYIYKETSTSPRDRLLMVGDSTSDAQFAHNCGIDFCKADYGMGAVCSKLPEPTYTVDAISKLIDYIVS